MAELNLSQAEADLLIAMEKHCLDPAHDYEYPHPGKSISIPLMSTDKKESFLLDIHKGRIDLIKQTFQERARKAVVLVRLDIGGPPHRNPDGVEVAAPHLHIYRENYGDKFAFPIPMDSFPNIADGRKILGDFMTYCNITSPPNIQMELF